MADTTIRVCSTNLGYFVSLTWDFLGSIPPDAALAAETGRYPQVTRASRLPVSNGPIASHGANRQSGPPRQEFGVRPSRYWRQPPSAFLAVLSRSNCHPAEGIRPKRRSVASFMASVRLEVVASPLPHTHSSARIQRRLRRDPRAPANVWSPRAALDRALASHFPSRFVHQAHVSGYPSSGSPFPPIAQSPALCYAAAAVARLVHSQATTLRQVLGRWYSSASPYTIRSVLTTGRADCKSLSRPEFARFCD